MIQCYECYPFWIRTAPLKGDKLPINTTKYKLYIGLIIQGPKKIPRPPPFFPGQTKKYRCPFSTAHVSLMKVCLFVCLVVGINKTNKIPQMVIFFTVLNPMGSNCVNKSPTKQIQNYNSYKQGKISPQLSI